MPKNELMMLAPGDEQILPAFEINSAWRVAWLRAIARAWRDPEYRDRLIGAPDGKRAKRATVADADRTTNPSTKAALTEAGFGFPKFFDKLLQIEVQECAAKPGQLYVPPKENGATTKPSPNGWKDFPADKLRAKLILILPPPPKDAKDFAVALADYDAGGRVYPFTWC
jgi:hypothetical protein